MIRFLRLNYKLAMTIMYIYVSLACVVVVFKPLVSDSEIAGTSFTIENYLGDMDDSGEEKDTEENTESNDDFLYSQFCLPQPLVSILSQTLFEKTAGFSNSYIDILSPPPKS